MGVDGVQVTTGTPAVSTGEPKSLYRRLHDFTPRLLFMMFFLSFAAFNFGYDQGNFSGLQALDCKSFVSAAENLYLTNCVGILAFNKRFGVWNAKKKTYQLTSTMQSIMTSTPYLGKLIGTWACTPLTERLGRKKMLAIIILFSYIGAALEVSASTAAQFTVGRIVCFCMAGFTVQVVPVYLAECAPPDLRGFIGSQVQFQINFSIMVASLVNLGVSHIHHPIQWRITIIVQFLMPTLMLLCYPLLLESPRW